MLVQSNVNMVVKSVLKIDPWVLYSLKVKSMAHFGYEAGRGRVSRLFLRNLETIIFRMQPTGSIFCDRKYIF